MPAAAVNAEGAFWRATVDGEIRERATGGRNVSERACRNLAITALAPMVTVTVGFQKCSRGSFIGLFGGHFYLYVGVSDPTRQRCRASGRVRTWAAVAGSPESHSSPRPDQCVRRKLGRNKYAPPVTTWTLVPLPHDAPLRQYS